MISLVRNAFFSLVMLFIFTDSAFSQVISLSSDRMQALSSRLYKEGYDLSFAQGLSVTDRTGRQTVDKLTDKINSRQISHYAYSLLALRLADKAIINLDAPLYEVFPDYDLGEFFTVPVTIRSLTAQSAGFSVPLFFTHPIAGRKPISRDFGDYIRPIRTAKTKTHEDPVATLLLVQSIEKITGKDITALLTDHVLVPLGLTKGDIAWQSNDNQFYPDLFKPVFELAISKRAILKMGNYLNRNRGGDEAFLSADSFLDLSERVTYAHHPLGHMRTSAQSQFAMNNHLMRTTDLYCHPTLGDQASLVVINDSRMIMLLERKGGKACLLAQSKGIVKDIIKNDIPSNLKFTTYRKREDIYKAMIEPIKPIQGIYMQDQTPSHWFTDRLNRIENGTMDITRTPGTENLQIKRPSDIIPREYIHQGPYLYKSRDGSQLIFSKFMGGGYANLDGVPYRYTGIMGDKDLLIDFYPLIILLNLTVLIYIRSTVHQAYRTMAKVISIGTILIAISIVLEKKYAVQFYYYDDLGYVISLWRIMLNIGLMFVITMPFFAMNFSKTNKMPRGFAKVLFTNIHLTLLTASTIALFLWAMTVNISGEFTP